VSEWLYYFILYCTYSIQYRHPHGEHIYRSYTTRSLTHSLMQGHYTVLQSHLLAHSLTHTLTRTQRHVIMLFCTHTHSLVHSHPPSHHLLSPVHSLRPHSLTPASLTHSLTQLITTSSHHVIVITSSRRSAYALAHLLTH
jgi:hypothetical protein